MSRIGFGQNGNEKYAGPGHWNDPDMLMIGVLGLWGTKSRPSRLTPDEQYTQMSLWSILAAPLLISCDLNLLDEFSLSLFTNNEVLAINQDKLGKQGYRVKKDGDGEIWKKQLSDGTIAVGLFNRGMFKRKIEIGWKDLGIEGEQSVRDLWRQKDLGSVKNSFSAEVEPHGVVLVKIGNRKEE
jgi:alpha-galactosidase